MTAPIDISALRHERRTRVGHQMLAHLRTDAYDVYRTPIYPPAHRRGTALSFEENVRAIEAAKQDVERRAAELHVRDTKAH